MVDWNVPTIRPHMPFDALDDARALRAAMKGMGTDEDAIIGVLTKRSAGQRGDIKNAFKHEFGRDLIKDLKSELGGKFEDLILALMDDSADYIAKQLHAAMNKVGTDEDILTEVLCTRGNEEIHRIIAAYQALYGKSLESAVSSEVSGDYKRLLVMLLSGVREHGSQPGMARAQAESLMKAGEGRLGTDEETFVVLLAHQSFLQLKMIFLEYENISGKTFEQAVNNELSGDLKEAILTIARCAECRPRYFAEKLVKAMKGAGTDDSTLVRIIVSRSEQDLEAIKQEFQASEHKTLSSAVKSETSGDYRNALISIIDGNC